MKKTTNLVLMAGTALLLAFAGLVALGLYWFQRDRNENLAIEKAGNALGENDFKTAIELFDQAIRLRLPSAKAASAYHGRAYAENEQGKYDEAIRDFSESIRLNPAGFEAYWGRGYAYQCKGEGDKALSDYAEVLRRDENAARVYFNRGLIYLERKNWAPAVQDFSEAIRCEPENSYAYLNRGSALAELGQLDGALASLDAAISINSQLAEAYQVRAVVHRRRSDPDRARNDELRAMAMEFAQPTSLLTSIPRTPGATQSASDLHSAALIAQAAGRYDEAIDLCNKALDTKPSRSQVSRVVMTRGNCYSSKGDWDHALRDYDDAVKIDPTNADALTNRGNAYARNKQRDKSIRDYNEAIRLNPKLFQAYCNRAMDYLAAGDLDRALADLTESIRLNPKFAEAFSRRSGVLMRLKRKDDALADADTAVALADSAEAYFLRGRLRVWRREFPEARADFERALERGRGPHSFMLNDVAWFFATCPDQSGRDGRKAVDLATKACEMTQWNDTHALDTLAAAFAEAGDFDEAIKWQAHALSLIAATAEERAGVEKRLALYQDHHPYRQEP